MQLLRHAGAAHEDFLLCCPALSIWISPGFAAFHATLFEAFASFAVVEGLLTFVQAVAKIRSRLSLPATLARDRFVGLFLRALVALLGIC